MTVPQHVACGAQRLMLAPCGSWVCRSTTGPSTRAGPAGLKDINSPSVKKRGCCDHADHPLDCLGFKGPSRAQAGVEERLRWGLGSELSPAIHVHESHLRVSSISELDEFATNPRTRLAERTGGGFGMACHNYDGDMLTDEVAQAPVHLLRLRPGIQPACKAKCSD